MTAVKQGRPFLSVEELTERVQRGALCSRCKQHKPLDQFGKDSSRKPLLVKSRCKPCEREYQADYRAKNADAKKKRDAEYYEKNKEQIKENVARYKLDNKEAILKVAREYSKSRTREQKAAVRHRRRAMLNGVLHIEFTVEEFNARMSMFGFKCWICKVGKFESVDHVKPVSKGGAHILANLRPCCLSCNASKKATWPFKVGDAK